MNNNIYCYGILLFDFTFTKSQRQKNELLESSYQLIYNLNWTPVIDLCDSWRYMGEMIGVI